MAEAFVLMGTLDDARQVSKHDLGVIDEVHLTDVWSQCCERVMRYFRESSSKC